MPYYVIDTNVFITASGKNNDATLACIEACQQFILHCYSSGSIICIDDTNLIMNEYSRYLNYSGNPTLADEFFRYIHENQGVAGICERVTITTRLDHDLLYNEIPDDPLLYGFDRSDQKFLAVSIASGNNAIIVNATDSDWENYLNEIQAHNVVINNLCP